MQSTKTRPKTRPNPTGPRPEKTETGKDREKNRPDWTRPLNYGRSVVLALQNRTGPDRPNGPQVIIIFYISS